MGRTKRAGVKPRGKESQEEQAPGDKAPTKRTRRPSEVILVSKAIKKIGDDLKQNKLKGTVGDLIRLLQLSKEMEEAQPREIKVSWVEPREEEHAGEK